MKRNNLSNEKEGGKEKKEVELLLLSVSNDEDCCCILLLFLGWLSMEGDVDKSSGCNELDKDEGVWILQKDRVVEKGVFDRLCTHVGDEGGDDSKAWTSTTNTDIVHVDNRNKYTAMIMVGQMGTILWLELYFI